MPVLTLQPDSAAGIDTYVSGLLPNANYGDSNQMSVYDWGAGGFYEHSLLKFDLSGIPAGATINSATLRLKLSGSPGVDMAVKVNRILAADSPWTEPGATWNYAVASSTRWAGDAGADGGDDAGCNVSGTDYAATPLGTFTVISTDPIDTEYAISLDLTEFGLMQASNNGLILSRGSGASNNHAQFFTSDETTSTRRPKLVIDYTPAGTLKYKGMSGGIDDECGGIHK